MKRFLSLFLFGLLYFIIPPDIFAQHPMRILFYNTENLFDYRDDSLRKEREFLPESARKWTFSRYRRKLINLTKVIMAAGEGEIPALVGMCEVNNDSVMQDLLRLTPLHLTGYRYFITQSPDERGINIALLYKRNLFRPIARCDYRISVPTGVRPTRDILHIAGEIAGGDTLDVLVCHFPSRSGGEKETRPARTAANRRLRQATDSLFRCRKNPLFVIMGDFNDYPAEKLKDPSFPLLSPEAEPQPDMIYNLMATLPDEEGSHKYDGRWGYLDQIFVSGNLLSPAPGPQSTHWGVFRAPFLLTDDTKGFGQRPMRTYYGYRHEGGYSDHLPVFVDLRFNEPPTNKNSDYSRGE